MAATVPSEPAYQPHGRHGTLLDPFGHRWMLSQPLEPFDLDRYRQRAHGSGFPVVGARDGEEVTVADRPGTGGGIRAAVFYDDTLADIRLLVEVFGLEELVVVAGETAGRRARPAALARGPARFRPAPTAPPTSSPTRPARNP